MEQFNIFENLLFIVFSINLIVLAIYDLKYKAVPDYLLLFALILSFFVTKYEFFDSLKNAFLCAGALVLLNFIVTFYIQNIKARVLKDESLKTQTALGEGDIPVIATFGIILGLNEAVFAIFLSAVIAIIHEMYLRFMKKEREVPFIPSLVIGFFIEYFFNLTDIFKDFY